MTEHIRNDHGTRESPTIRTEDIAVRLEDMNIKLEGLVNRIEALEQLNQHISNKDNLTEGSKAFKGRADTQEPQPSREGQAKTEALAFDPQRHPHTEPEHLRSDYIEFREEVFIQGKFEWRPVDSSRNESQAQTQAFRYDTDKNGNAVFSVFRGASTLYDKLYELCNPANHGQVNEREGRLEIADLNPLLRAYEDLKRFEETLNSDEDTLEGKQLSRLKGELHVLFQLYDKQDGQFSHLWRAQKRLDEMLKTGKWDWKSLKGLFHTNQLVVFRELRDEWAVARVTMVSSNDDHEYNIRMDRVQLQLDCEAVEFDGNRCRAHLYRKAIPQYAGTMDIIELPVYPLEYSPDKENIWKDSIESGKRWKDLIDDLGKNRVVVRQYQGYCETFGKNADDETGGKGSALDGRVVVDPARFPDRLLRFTKDNQDPFKRKSVCDETWVLCPERVLVHSLSDNEWYYVAMSRLEKPQWDKKAWSRLVKPNSKGDKVRKSIDRIKSLAEAHRSQKSATTNQNMGNFKGKGKGLTFLLHGSPGIGKTMLAECLSEDRERPLYRINLGRLIGDDRWESRIEEIFRQAHLWEAILLVDEAEVVLAERTQENMHQSAWVAVFLRKVEYFEGIIFLTTNLIHMIDPAFISRVNLGIKIPDLDVKTRSQLWKKVLEENGTGGKELSQRDKLVSKWADRELNGRQIRNVLLSASLMASHQDKDIDEKDIQEALDDVQDFTAMIGQEKKAIQQKYMSEWD